jgi:hypothetical protein
MTSLDEYYAQDKQDPTDWNPEDDHSV